jgi:hypothetical protein
VDLGNTLALNFLVIHSKLTGSDNYAIITRTYADGTVEVSEPIQQGDWSFFSNPLDKISYANIAGKEMTDMVTCQIFNKDGEPVSVIWKDSIQSYIMRKLNETMVTYAKNPTVALKNQLTAMVELLSYGGAAQRHFEHNVTDMADAYLTEEHMRFASEEQTQEGLLQRDSYYCYDTAMSLESRLQFRFMFIKPRLSNVAYAIVSHQSHSDPNGDPIVTRYEISEFQYFSSALVYVPVETLAAADGDMVITCTLYDQNGEVITTVSDSMNSYLGRKQATTGDIYWATLRYTRACFAYLHP